jgi:hypoxanthine phosphoribosyltransferase
MDWQEFEQALATLANKISEKPDAIVCVVRGGMIPGRLLCNHLGVKQLYCLSINKATRQLTTDILDDLTGQTVVLVEDTLETGTNLATSKQYLETRGATVLTAAMYCKPGGLIVPDFYLEIRDKLPVFPWEN